MHEARISIVDPEPENKSFHQCDAFSLVEVTIALGIASFCLLSILGLLLTGLTSEKSTVGQTIASSLLSQVYSELASASGTDAKTKTLEISLSQTSMATPQTLYFSESGKPTGQIGTAPTADSRYRVSIGLQRPTAPTAHAPTIVRIIVTWPAAADPKPNQWPSSQASMVEAVTTLSLD